MMYVIGFIAVPGLEDVPEIIRRIENDAMKAKDRMEPPPKDPNKFAGLKKGFLGQPVKSSRKKSKDDLPYIKASVKNDLVLDEVQKAMENDFKIDDFQDDLTSRLKSNPDISTVLEDPLWISILHEFQQDAEKAMEKYKNNDSVKNTMLKLCKLFGDSFLHMDSGSKNEEEVLVDNLMESQVVKDALINPYISRMMDLMKENKNDQVVRMLQEANSCQKKKIQVLIDHGLFSFQS